MFVLTAARSYSSVIATMIGQHPDLAGLPELKLFFCATIAELDASLPRFWIERGVAHRSPGLVRALAHLEFGDQSTQSLTLARAWLRLRGHWSGTDVLDALMTRLSPRATVEKSPENVMSDAALARLAGAYPRARYLHLTRHPVTTLRSMQSHWTRMKMPASHYPTALDCIATWYDVHRRIVAFTANLPRDRWLRVRAEDVLNDVDASMRAIAAWLGVRTDDAAISAMKEPQASPFARFGPDGSGVTGGNDPLFLSDPVPHAVDLPPALEPPAELPGDGAVWNDVGVLAERLGYT